MNPIKNNLAASALAGLVSSLAVSGATLPQRVIAGTLGTTATSTLSVLADPERRAKRQLHRIDSRITKQEEVIQSKREEQSKLFKEAGWGNEKIGKMRCDIGATIAPVVSDRRLGQHIRLNEELEKLNNQREISELQREEVQKNLNKYKNKT